MSRPALAKARELARILGFSALFALAVILVNLLVMGAFVAAFGSLEGRTASLGSTAVEELSDELVREGTSYALPEEAAKELRGRQQWAMLIDDAGDVAWAEGLPADVPRHYALADVAQFSRWYLNDYPVVTRVRDDGLLVVGSPKGSTWKYGFSTDMGLIVLTLGLLVALLLADMVVALVVARAYARRSWAERDHARREWIAAVSHDVRTPLTVALADADELAADEGLAPAQRSRAARVERKLCEVASFVADLNIANRLSYAMEPADARPVLLAPVIRSVAAEALNDDADGSHPIEVCLPADAEELVVRGDEKLIRRMLANLVGNSVRHNPQGCSVRVSLARMAARPLRRQRCLLVVEDDGRGLERDTLASLQKAPSGELPEHGLGLVIVRRIAAACGGRARFMDADGGGARCEVELPLAGAAPRG